MHAQIVFSSDLLERKCEEVANRLLCAVTMTHIDRYGDALCKKNFQQNNLDHNNVGGNCCAAAFVDEQLQEYYLGYNMLPISIKQIACERIVDLKNIAVFLNGGRHIINSDVFIMFDEYYKILYPLQGMSITPSEGRQTDAEERLLLALRDQQVQNKLKPKKWSTMVFVSSMDTCKYCALSLSGFLMQQQKFSFAGKNSYHIRNIKVYFPFAYEDRYMKNIITPDSHIMLLPPHVEHHQYNYQLTINTIFLTLLENIQNGDNLLVALLAQLQNKYVFENEFIKRLFNQKDRAEKIVLFPGFIPMFEQFLSDPIKSSEFAKLLDDSLSVIFNQNQNFFQNLAIKRAIQKHVSTRCKLETQKIMKKLGIM